ncbi:MAG: SLC13/DASS family transporter [Herbiconiux sp.]|uniref:SLC13 family permease n=1 Tax=Herbiconiux sp. TaxID=1871186 RepID=UPI0011FF9B54|nr:SLC13 family permease [Herbiconiux sp.]TAJ48612.1 MAG: SLC13/DASS family transporter [Herbiconiux sp.]
MSPIAITLIVLIAAIALFVWNKVPVGLVAIGVALALYFTGVIGFEQTIAGFGDPVIIFIAALFVVGEGLDATGVTTWAGQQLTRRAGTKRSTIVVLVSLLVAALTAVISVNGAVAALVPMAVVLAIRIRQPPSQLLMPLAFAAHAGSLLLLSGTPVNLLISELADDATGRPIGYAEFALVGIPLLAGTILVLVFLGPRLLPHRMAEHAPRDLSQHAETLAHQYSLDLEPGQAALDRETGLTEVVVPPRSEFIGETVFPGMVTESGELVIVAVQRGGEDQGRTVLAAGDVMLLQGTWDALTERTVDPNVVVVDEPASVRRQAVPLSGRAWSAIVILVGMVALLATGLVPPAIAALLAAGAMVLLRVVTVAQAHRSISWTTLILVAGMIPLSTAIQVSGAADLIAGGIVDVLGSASPYLLVLGISVVTIVLGQLISNMATALILAPIAVAIAGETGISPLPLLMAVAVSAAASFLTPVATPANTMVLGPGGYRFGDYWKLGLPLIAVFLLVATFVVPLFWPF